LVRRAEGGEEIILTRHGHPAVRLVALPRSGACHPVGTSIEAWFASDGTVNPPLGVRGGREGGRSGQWKRSANGDLTIVEPCGGVMLSPGETLVARCCGGGGYGDPLTRDPSRVVEDVVEGWISKERARAVYGVVIGDGGVLDPLATAQERAKRVTALARS
jgi:N-methylhydantoinase B